MDLEKQIVDNFPFKPYEIQIQFAKSMFEAIENQKFAILESPTGTGKTLSIIVGAFLWLQTNQFNYSKLKQGKILKIQQNSKIEENKIFESKNEKNQNSKNQQQDDQEDISQILEKLPSWLQDLSNDNEKMGEINYDNSLKKYQEDDIEEMKKTALNCSVCPYYLSKKSVANADIICLPYVSLVDKGTRQSLGIDLKNKILIFDEAHNLLESAAQIFSKEINFKQIVQVISELQTYLTNFKNRLKAQNILFINQIINLCKNLFEYMKKKNSEKNQSQNNNNDQYQKISVLNFLADIKLDMFDISKLQKFVEDTKLTHKIHYYNLNLQEKKAKKQEQQKQNNNQQQKQQKQDLEQNKNNIQIQQQIQQNDKEKKSKNKENYEQYLPELKNLQEPQILQKFFDFLNFCIFEENQKSVIILKKDSKSVQNFSIKLQNLNCFSHIEEIISESQAMILTGGTMEPVSEFNMLINLIGKDNYLKKQFKHIIPEQNFKAYIISSINESLINNNNINQEQQLQFANNCINKSQEKVFQIKFDYENKNNLESQYKLYNTCIFIIQQISQIIPGGLIVFMQSYPTLEQLQNYLQKEQSKNFKNTKIFYDSNKKQNCEQILKNYTQSVEQKNCKNILISVMGGKLSEGINFKDDMARGVIVFGLPYSNKNSPELKEKMLYYDNQKCPNFNGQEYYLNLCMKTVNQTIGRCIRHVNDYAITYLVDFRFQQQNIQEKLSQWVREKLDNETKDFNQIIQKTQDFFKLH